MGWKPGPERYLKPGREWKPKWRFSPFTNREDAFELLDSLVERFTLTGAPGPIISADVQIGNSTGRASGESTAWVIAMAVSRALGLSEDAK